MLTNTISRKPRLRKVFNASNNVPPAAKTKLYKYTRKVPWLMNRNSQYKIDPTNNEVTVKNSTNQNVIPNGPSSSGLVLFIIVSSQAVPAIADAEATKATRRCHVVVMNVV